MQTATWIYDPSGIKPFIKDRYQPSLTINLPVKDRHAPDGMLVNTWDAQIMDKDDQEPGTYRFRWHGGEKDAPSHKPCILRNGCPFAERGWRAIRTCPRGIP
mmetsp:Transcript_2700/g.5255  ORF Transcript_2700/g.5255 Transcript_2700/m.5255 type:complete len:102 (+) Transcript_2700:550-855(+)